MPVILPEEDWPKWLGEAPASETEIKALLKAYPSEQMTLWPVDKKVGNVRNNSPDLIRPVELTTPEQADLLASLDDKDPKSDS